MGRLNIEAYHGTAYDRPFGFDEDSINEAMLFDQLASNHSELNAVYFSNNQHVCNFFGERKIVDPENQLQALVRVEIDASNVFQIDFTPDQAIEYNGAVYEFPEERPSLYSALRKDGYQVVVTKGDYMENGEPADDIAVLDDSCISVKDVQMLFGENWTGWLSKDQAKRVFSRWTQTYDANELSSDYHYISEDRSYAHHALEY